MLAIFFRNCSTGGEHSASELLGDNGGQQMATLRYILTSNKESSLPCLCIVERASTVKCSQVASHSSSSLHFSLYAVLFFSLPHINFLFRQCLVYLQLAKIYDVYGTQFLTYSTEKDNLFYLYVRQDYFPVLVYGYTAHRMLYTPRQLRVHVLNTLWL
jgi:hypothetical protein